MNASAQCPNCSNDLAVDISSIGQMVQCSECGELFRVPRALADELVTPPPICHRPLSEDTAAKIGSGRRVFVAWIVVAAVAFIAGVSIAGAIGWRLTAGTKKAPVPAISKLAPQASRGNTDKRLDSRVPTAATKVQAEIPAQLSTWKPIVDRAKKSVVLIRSMTAEGAVGTGSGFFVVDSKTILTNYHVIDDAESILVVLSDGTTLPAAGFASVAQGRDLAVVRLERPIDGLGPLPLAKSVPEPGERVLALGAPHGLAGTVTDGIASGIRTGRDLDAASHGGYSFETLNSLDTEWLQISAPISPGNSGGPLLNETGDVVGVNALSRQREGTQNLNFAVSLRHVREILSALPAETKPFTSLPVRGTTAADVALEVVRKRQAESELALVAKADADRKKALAALESARVSRERLDELRRVSDQIVQVRRELSRIESDGVALQARHDEAVAQGKAVFLVGTQIARRSVVALTQLGDLEGCVRRRQAVVNGMLAVLDNHPAPYDAAGLAQVRLEYSLKQSEVADLRSQATVAEASFVKLDQETKSLVIQLKYLAEQREAKRKELQNLLDRQTALQAAKP